MNQTEKTNKQSIIKIRSFRFHRLLPSVKRAVKFRTRSNNHDNNRSGRKCSFSDLLSKLSADFYSLTNPSCIYIYINSLAFEYIRTLTKRNKTRKRYTYIVFSLFRLTGAGGMMSKKEKLQFPSLSLSRQIYIYISIPGKEFILRFASKRQYLRSAQRCVLFTLGPRYLLFQTSHKISNNILVPSRVFQNSSGAFARCSSIASIHVSQRWRKNLQHPAIERCRAFPFLLQRSQPFFFRVFYLFTLPTENPTVLLILLRKTLLLRHGSF